MVVDLRSLLPGDRLPAQSLTVELHPLGVTNSWSAGSPARFEITDFSTPVSAKVRGQYWYDRVSVGVKAGGRARVDLTLLPSAAIRSIQQRRPVEEAPAILYAVPKTVNAQNAVVGQNAVEGRNQTAWGFVWARADSIQKLLRIPEGDAERLAALRREWAQHSDLEKEGRRLAIVLFDKTMNTKDLRSIASTLRQVIDETDAGKNPKPTLSFSPLESSTLRIESTRLATLRPSDRFGIIGHLTEADGAPRKPAAPKGDRKKIWGNDDGMLAQIGTLSSPPGVFDASSHRSYRAMKRDGMVSGRLPKITTGRVLVEGKLPREIVQRIVRQRHAQLRRCYATGLKDKATLKGRIAIRFTIDAAGTIVKPSLEASTLADKNVETCIVRTFASMKFPDPEKGNVSVSYELLLEAG